MTTEWPNIYIYVPSANQIVKIAEGTGDCLSDGDVDRGYCDYISYEQYSLGEDIDEVDGGIILQSGYLHELYASLEDCISEVLDAAYGDVMLDYILLEQKEGDETDGAEEETK